MKKLVRVIGVMLVFLLAGAGGYYYYTHGYLPEQGGAADQSCKPPACVLATW